MNCLVVGFKISGKSAAKLLQTKGHRVFVFDSCQNVKEEIIKEGFICINNLTDDFLKTIHLCVVSPSVRPKSELICKLKKHCQKVIGELELGYQYSSGKCYAITGTNGKTTSVELLKRVLGQKALALGNIGLPITSFVEAKCKVCEVSSFQLCTIENFRPQVAGITYIGVDHLDYHETENEYINAKYNIAKNMCGKDKLVVNADDENSMKLAFNAKCKIWTYSSVQKCRGAYVENDKIYFIKKNKPRYIMDTKDIKLVGKHNLNNVLLVVAMAMLIGVKPKTIRKKISTFYGLEHRVQKIATIDGVTYINDSKATNISATKVAIESVKDNIILLLGGYDKGYEYDELVKFLTVKKVIVFGGVKDKILRAFERNNFTNYITAENLKQATGLAKQIAQDGDNVLLSPASSSHDEFESYKHRGEAFEKYVLSEE